jgi:hypothetical protein
MRLAGEPLDEGLGEARLADAGLARQQHDAALAGRGLPPAPLQHRQLLVAADERRGGRAQRLKAALRAALAQYPPSDDRCRQALDLDRPEILVVEQPAGQPPGARPDHHSSRRGKRQQPRREVGRLADHRLLLRRTLADQIADHDEPSGDPDPHLQPHLGCGVDPRNARPCGRPSGGGHRLD